MQAGFSVFAFKGLVAKRYEMIKATKDDRQLIVQILAESFDDNQSVNYIIPQTKSRKKRLFRLMEYSFDVCFTYGDIFLNQEKTACCLILYPNDPGNKTFKKTLLDLRLILSSIGLSNLYKASVREARIKAVHPVKKRFAHLWYIGVFKKKQGIGIGTLLLNEVIDYYEKKNFPVYLETSTERNLSWYNANSFFPFETLDFTYKLYCFKKSD